MNEENAKREYVSEKEYVVYVPQSSGTYHGFLKDIEGTMKLQESICDATRFTSVEANRELVKFQKNDSLGRYPFKLKICEYKNMTF